MELNELTFSEVIRQVQDRLTNHPEPEVDLCLRELQDLYQHDKINTPQELETFKVNLQTEAEHVATVANSRDIHKNAKIGRLALRPMGWIVWAELIHHPISENFGQQKVHATILSDNGELLNIQPETVNYRDYPKGINGPKVPLSEIDDLAKIVKRSSLTEINLESGYLGFNIYREHLAEFVIKNQLQASFTPEASAIFNSKG